MEELSLENKVKVLEERLEKLEKIERKRQRTKWIKIILKIIAYLSIILLMYLGYRYIKKNYMEPYDNLKATLKENVDKIKNYDYNSLFDLFK